MEICSTLINLYSQNEGIFLHSNVLSDKKNGFVFIFFEVRLR